MKKILSKASTENSGKNRLLNKRSFVLITSFFFGFLKNFQHTSCDSIKNIRISNITPNVPSLSVINDLRKRQLFVSVVEDFKSIRLSSFIFNQTYKKLKLIPNYIMI